MTNFTKFPSLYLIFFSLQVMIGYAKKDQTVKGVDIIVRDIRLHRKHCTLRMNNNQQWEISSLKVNTCFLYVSIFNLY